jgi:hypothetical protein
MEMGSMASTAYRWREIAFLFLANLGLVFIWILLFIYGGREE